MSYKAYICSCVIAPHCRSLSILISFHLFVSSTGLETCWQVNVFPSHSNNKSTALLWKDVLLLPHAKVESQKRNMYPYCSSISDVTMCYTGTWRWCTMYILYTVRVIYLDSMLVMVFAERSMTLTCWRSEGNVSNWPRLFSDRFRCSVH